METVIIILFVLGAVCALVYIVLLTGLRFKQFFSAKWQKWSVWSRESENNIYMLTVLGKGIAALTVLLMLIMFYVRINSLEVALRIERDDRVRELEGVQRYMNAKDKLDELRNNQAVLLRVELAKLRDSIETLNRKQK